MHLCAHVYVCILHMCVFVHMCVLYVCGVWVVHACNKKYSKYGTKMPPVKIKHY